MHFAHECVLFPYLNEKKCEHMFLNCFVFLLNLIDFSLENNQINLNYLHSFDIHTFINNYYYIIIVKE